MGSGIPLLNEYKQEFFWKRFPQTILGGPKLRLGYSAPANVYIAQIVLFVLPLIFGVCFTAAAEVITSVSSTIWAYVIAGMMCLLVLIVNIIGAVSRAKKSAIAPIMKGGPNILAEDDQVQFESCCGIETIEFVIPGKKFKVNIILHALIAAVVAGFGFLYLLPTNLNILYGDDQVATVIVCGVGWIVMIIGLYSLTVGPPPEWAQFRAIDTHENYTPLMRPFYIIALCAVDFAAGFFPELLLCNQILHVVFLFLPIFWTIGLLPPLDALFLWLFEQAHTVLFGGSAMATDLRTAIYLCGSILVFLVAYFIPSAYGAVVVMSGCGFILSLDLGGMGQQLINMCSKTPSNHQPKNGFLWQWSWKEILFYLVFCIFSIGVAVGAFYLSQQSDLSQVGMYLGLAMIGLLGIDVMLSQLQAVYVLFGLVRNKLYPKSVARSNLFKKRKKKLDVVGVIRKILIDIVAPFLILAYLGLSLNLGDYYDIGSSTSNSTSTVLDIIGATRAFRWAWQSRSFCILDIATVQLLSLILTDVSSWSSLSLGLRLLVISFARDRLFLLCDKLYLFLSVLMSSWLDKKQRRPSTLPWMLVNILLLPVVLAVMSVAAMLSAPMLPLFTLPIFFIGYPRPTRFWPGQVGASANFNADTVFYKQLTPQLCKALRKVIGYGSLGDATPGRHFLARFQDRVAWVQVLERGFCYCALSLKGLELQETSCHTVEASRIDDIIDTTFEREEVPCCLFNKYPICTLKPRDAALISTYSDAKNQLTGIMDSPDTLKAVVKSFHKALTWVILHEVRKSKQDPSTHSIVGNIEANSRPNSSSSQTGLRSRRRSITPPIVPKDSWVTNQSSRPNSRSGSALSYGGLSSWSDNDSLLASPEKSNQKVNLAQHAKGFNNNAHPSSGAAGKPSSNVQEMRPMQKPMQRRPQSADKQGEMTDVDNLFDELGFGMPVMDINQSNPSPNMAFTTNKLPKLFGGSNTVTVLADPSKLSSALSMQLAPPSKWLEVPVESSLLSGVEISAEWYQRVVKLLHFAGTGNKGPGLVAEEVAADTELYKVYSQIIAACHLLLNVLGLSGSDALSMGAMHVYKIYNGDIPWSGGSEWITEDPQLTHIVIKAYRYAVKLAIEQAIMGGDEFTMEEMQEYLEEYDKDWYIGTEKDPGWQQAVEADTPQLFSFTHDQVAGVYHSRVLSLVETPVYLASLNSEVVRAQWANLNLELYYMTNDDEERYSIQANSSLLRNLTVQAADPPLGYPIYASPPISVPTL